MTVMQVAEVRGMVLTYDTDDVADIGISTPHDVESRTVDGFALLELGTARLHLDIAFLPGKAATWVLLPQELTDTPRADRQQEGGQ